MKPRLRVLVAGGLLAALMVPVASQASATASQASSTVASPALSGIDVSSFKSQLCDDRSLLCTDVANAESAFGYYVGHDEPSTLFYSSTPGAGVSQTYQLTLPKDPPTLPTQDGNGGTFGFQLHPAFWFGLAMCDNQSAPNPGGSTVSPNIPCTPNSDSNIYDNASPTAADYIGKHPGSAFMEMQFYPPGWAPWPAGNSCDALKWCAALNIDSLSQNMNTGQDNNQSCLNTVGVEPVNFAFLTKNGVAHAPANPVDATLATFTPNPATDFFMNSGDNLAVDMHDTPTGFEIVIRDKTTNSAGSMKASVANQFGMVNFDPTGTTCQNIPQAYHPMYATSSEHTRVPWAAHSYNVAFSDETGHFEYCAQVDPSSGNCSSAPNATDPTLDSDDVGCFQPADSTRIQIGGCLGTDTDFDGAPYQLTWPGTIKNPKTDRAVHSQPIRFSSPMFRTTVRGGGDLRDYQRVAFETDLPRIEFATPTPCNRSTGAGCVNPPQGANFYPIYTTNRSDGTCTWQLGGAYIPGTTNTFGGTSTAEYGPLLQSAYPDGGTSVLFYNNYRNVLPNNPCRNNN